MEEEDWSLDINHCHNCEGVRILLGKEISSSEERI